jgi:hypothetical protein
MIKIYIPDLNDHSGDTFRELVNLWEENGLVEIIKTKSSNLVWWNNIGDILLYDRPTLQWISPNLKANKVLWGNTVPDGGIPWIFWGRRPKLMEKIIKEEGRLSYQDRKTETIFLGKVENNVQMSFRQIAETFKGHLTEFDMPINGNYKYDQYQYLQRLRDSKYGLCLRGFGPKCNREIELLSLGVVPIITPGVDLTFFEPLIEDEHYITANSPQEMISKLDEIDENKWTEMSNAGIEWYERNASVKGSFETTKKIIETP